MKRNRRWGKYWSRSTMKNAVLAEFLGTGFLLVSVVGSGIMAETLAGGNIALALLANAIATGCMLYCIITLFCAVSGAHFNPIVSLAFVLRGEMPITRACAFISAQIFGAITGVILTHAMFDQSLFQLSQTPRSGGPLWVSEIFASFGLLLIVFGGLAQNSKAIATMVALYITGAYWFTASTSFANPAVSIARALSDTFAGIDPAHVPMFILCQLIGMALALWAVRAVFNTETSG
ncbi:aquaporin family protein [Planktomarina temperata]|nr:aquaporin family protein [Planktomarina temperata]MDB4199809.1 aquaporin family protein [Planktomarina temperata]MDC1193763.1 aquaporin family protein [Planktomarina temperata]